MLRRRLTSIHSMAGAMLVLLAACGVTKLRELMSPDTVSAGDHLKSLLLRWQEVSSGPASPSVIQSVRIIEAANTFIKEMAGSRSETARANVVEED